MTAPEAMIELRRVVKKFKNAAGEVTVLKGIDLTLRRGEFAAIVGKSGSGKSTLLNMITGIDHPTAGQVVIGGTDLYTMTESRRSRWRGNNLGIVFQFFQLLPMLSLLENVMLPMDYAGRYDFDERPRRALELLGLVGLAEHAYKHPDAVSTGQQQSAAIARALATDPPVLVADEPTGNLDTRSADIIIELFQALVRQGKTIAMVTHDPSLTRRVDRTIIISDGELVDEALAQAWPQAPHRQLLAATQQMERRPVAAGAPLWEAGAPAEHVYVVAAGQVEVWGDQPAPVRHGAGQVLDPAMVAGARAAGDGPAEVVRLPRAAYHALAQAAPIGGH